MRKDSQELIKRLLSRDRRAVSEFYTGYSNWLRRYISHKVANSEDAEEIMQDVLFAFLESLRDFTGKASLKTYLCAITNHKIIDYYRRKKIKRVVFSQLPPRIEQLIAEVVNYEEIVDNQLLAQKIASVFNKLSPTHARALKLKYMEGLSVIQIAKNMACSLKAAESALFRARKSFVKLYIGSERGFK
ncbi:MAG: RNA polymerase sigma factor [Patescibacteria group bacterium]